MSIHDNMYVTAISQVTTTAILIMLIIIKYEDEMASNGITSI
jgi:hypothetical protein